MCDGDNSTCLDACGVPNGDNSTCADLCGVPYGDNTSCDGCMDATACNYDPDALTPTITAYNLNIQANFWGEGVYDCIQVGEDEWDCGDFPSDHDFQVSIRNADNSYSKQYSFDYYTYGEGENVPNSQSVEEVLLLPDDTYTITVTGSSNDTYDVDAGSGNLNMTLTNTDDGSVLHSLSANTGLNGLML